MPRISSVTCYDDLLKIRLSKLREWGYLKNDRSKSGTLTWSRFDEPFSSIGITVYMYGDESRITLSYNHNDQSRKYDISLVSLPSNLGTGEVWYFLCPYTKKRCRVLYLIGGHFLHGRHPAAICTKAKSEVPLAER